MKSSSSSSRRLSTGERKKKKERKGRRHTTMPQTTALELVQTALKDHDDNDNDGEANHLEPLAATKNRKKSSKMKKADALEKTTLEEDEEGPSKLLPGSSPITQSKKKRKSKMPSSRKLLANTDKRQSMPNPSFRASVSKRNSSSSDGNHRTPTHPVRKDSSTSKNSSKQRRSRHSTLGHSLQTSASKNSGDPDQRRSRHSTLNRSTHSSASKNSGDKGRARHSASARMLEDGIAKDGSKSGKTKSKKQNRKSVAATISRSSMYESPSLASSNKTPRTSQNLSNTHHTTIPLMEEAESMEDTADDNSKSKSRSSSRLRKARSLFGGLTSSRVIRSMSSDEDLGVESSKPDNKTGSTKEAQSLLGWAKKKMASTANLNSNTNVQKTKKEKRYKRKSKASEADDDADGKSKQKNLLDLVVGGITSGHSNNKQPQGAMDVSFDDEIASNDIDKSELLENSEHLKINHSTSGRGNLSGMSGMNSSGTMDGSQECPPVWQIKAVASQDGNLVDDGDISDIGENTNHDYFPREDVLEPEVIDGVTVFYHADSDDIVYEKKRHPGTVFLRSIIREILDDTNTDRFSPKIYKLIKKRLKNRKFLVRYSPSQPQPDVQDLDSWREATKQENIQLLGAAFEKELRRQRNEIGSDDSDDDPSDSEIDISLEGSGRAPSFQEMSKENKLAMIKTHRNNGDEDSSPTMSSIKHTALPFVVPADDGVEPNSALTPRQGNLEHNLSYRSEESNAMKGALRECRLAREVLAGDHHDDAVVQDGMVAEEKLALLLARMAETDEEDGEVSSPIGLLNDALNQLDRAAHRRKYASIAPLLERLQKIESEMEHCVSRKQQKRETRKKRSERQKEQQKDKYHSNDTGRHGRNERQGDVQASNDDRALYGDDTDSCDISGLHDDVDYRSEEDRNYDNNFDGDDDSDDESRTNLPNGHILNLDGSDDDVSSVGDSGIYSESEDEMSGENSRDVDISSVGDDEDGIDSDSDDGKPKKILEKKNQKLEQYFDRVDHLFQTRRKFEERASAVDPSGKFQKIKVKAHSGGTVIEEEGQVYKKEYQQRDPSDRIVRNLDDLYEAAELAQPEFESFLRLLAEEINGLDVTESLIVPKLKSRDRAFEKANSEYFRRNPGPPESWLHDIVRGGIVCKSIKQLKDVNNWLSSSGHLVQAKNRFLEPVFNGYRDLLYHVSIPYQDALVHICEIQVHLEDIYVMNKQFGTIKHYEYFRSCFANPSRSQENTLSDLSMMNEHGKIAGRLMKMLLKSTDIEQLRLFAGLCRGNLDEFDRSLELYRRILHLQEQSHGPEDQELATTYLNIGLVLGALGDTDESLLNLLKSLAIQENFLGMEHIEVANTYVEIGHMLVKRGDYSGAYSQYQRALVIREKKLGKDHFLVIKSLQDIGLVLQKKGDFEESETEYRRALGIQQQVLAEGHPNVATTHSLIGTTLSLYGDYEKAMAEHKLALSIREEKLGKIHSNTADSHSAIGVVLYHLGDLKSSRWHHKRALWIRESVLGKNDIACAASHSALGEILSCCEDDEGAVIELKRSLNILETNVGMDNPVTAGSYLELGDIYSRHGKDDDALAQYRKAKVIRESILGQNHPDTALTYMCMGKALGKMGKGYHEEALAMHKKAVVVFESMLGDTHPVTATGYSLRGDTFASNGFLEAGLNEHQKALKIRKTALKVGHPDIAESWARIGNLQLADPGDEASFAPKNACYSFRQVLTNLVHRCGEDHPDTAMAHVDVARSLLVLAEETTLETDEREGFWDEATGQLRTALSIFRTMDPSVGKHNNSDSNLSNDSGSASENYRDEAVLGRTCVTLATILETRGNDEDEEEAQKLYTEGLECLTSWLGEDHPETKGAKEKLLAFRSTRSGPSS